MKVAVLALVLAMCCSFGSVSQSLSDLTFGTDSTFDVVTWNIEWFPKSGQTTIDSVQAIVAAMNADVIGLQEIDDTVKLNEIADAIPGWESAYGTGHFSRLAFLYNTVTIDVIRIFKIYTTFNYWNMFPRAPLVMELAYKGDTIYVINNHLKCCGNGYLDLNNNNDEETRRLNAMNLLKAYIDNFLSDKRVILIGDLNDRLTDNASNNVFQQVLNDPLNYRFADWAIANSGASNWSYPGWPSHLDHILVTNEVFHDLESDTAEVRTIKVDEYLNGGFNQYDWQVSDHRPVGMRIPVTPIPPMPVDTMEPPDTSDPGPVGISEPTFHASLLLFPNPATTHLTFRFGGQLSNPAVHIADLTGRSIFVVPAAEPDVAQMVDIALLPAGVYMVQLKDGVRTVAIQKLLKR